MNKPLTYQQRDQILRDIHAPLPKEHNENCCLTPSPVPVKWVGETWIKHPHDSKVSRRATVIVESHRWFDAREKAARLLGIDVQRCLLLEQWQMENKGAKP